METIYFLVLIPMVYLALAVFLIGIIYRIVSIWRKPKNPSTLAIYPDKKPRWLWAVYDTFLMPSVRKNMPVVWVFHMFFHVCLLLLIIGHLELIPGVTIFQSIFGHQVFLGKGFVGLILTVCILFFLFRRFHSPYRELSVPEDYYILILLLLTVVFGAQMNWARQWYGYVSFGVEDYREYVWSLITFRPAMPAFALDTGHPFMLVVHVFFANLFLMFMPFTKIMHTFFSLPMNKLRRG